MGKTQRRMLRTLLIIIGLASISLHAEDPLTGAPLSSGFVLTGPEFLPVEQAYQLHASTGEKLLLLDWSIAPGYYLYLHQFKFLSGNKPLKVDAVYETGTSKYDDYFERELEVFYDQTRIQLPLSAIGKQLTVESQACADAGLCYPPRQHLLTISSNGVSISQPEKIQAQTPQNGSPLALILILALAGGAILNLMPCVFPVLSIKALSLTQARLSSHNKHLHGLAYTLGIVVTFTGVAALLISLRTAGSAIGWGFQLQSPIFICALIYLFVLMGLSFSGLFEMGARFMNVGQKRTSGNSLFSSFMTGVLATVVASPCTAPFMGTALGFALTQTTLTALLIFVFLGLGMALPFLVLTWWPGLTDKMPHPGPWMERFKEFLAYPLYLSAAWLLWVLGHQTDVDLVIVVLVSLILTSLALWFSQMTARGHTRMAKLAVVSLIIAAAVVLPVNHYQQRNTDSSRPQLWESYSASRLQELRQNDKPVFINLTADWCLTCLANEKLALSSDRFHQALKNKGITYLKGDWTNYNPEITALLNQNNRNGVPLYLLYPGNQQAPLILPQLLTENITLNAINTLP